MIYPTTNYHVKQFFWLAIHNKTIVDRSKTKEVVFRRPTPRLNVDVLPVSGVDQVDAVRLLSLMFSHRLRFDSHERFILKLCSQCSYLIRKLRDATIRHLPGHGFYFKSLMYTGISHKHEQARFQLIHLQLF